MIKHKKIAAFILSFTLCAASAAAPVYSAFADEEEATEAAEESANTETETESDDDSDEDEDDYITSGDYKYSLTDDDEVCIQEYIGSDTDVSIPDTIDGKSVTEIGEYAFFETDIVSVNIPAGIDYIADNPFVECYSLKEITVDEDNSYYSAADGVLYLTRSSNTMLLCYPQGKEDKTFTVPDDATEIGVSAMYATQLEEITMSAGITYIYRHGLSYNENLMKLDMSQCTELEELTDMMLAYCTALSEVILPPNLTSIGAGTFAGCSSLCSIELPETLTSIGQNAFAATGLKNVMIPENVMDIGYCAFGYDENLEPLDNFIILGTSGSAAETYCTDTDEEYDYENNFTFLDSSYADLIGDFATFETKSYDEYMYCEKDGEIYILSCTAVDSKIEIPSEIDDMPVVCIYGASFYQSQASEIVIPDTVTRIGSLAFADCSYLTKITIPESVTEIDGQVFSGCTSLETIEIPASCKTLGDEVFYGCTAMKEFTVADRSQYFSAEDGILFNADKTTLVAYPTAKTDNYYKAPDSVTEILMSAFAGCTSLENVDVTSVITIGDYAFEDCLSLYAVKLSEDLTTVGECAFYNCTSLLAMKTYNKITEIGTAAIGYYYDSTDTENDGDVLVDGFILYAEEDSGGARYALLNSIECEYDMSLYTEPKDPAPTIEIFGVKVERTFFFVVLEIIVAAIAAAAAFFISKHAKKNKAEKELEQKKQNAEQKLAIKEAEAAGKD